MKHIRHSRLLLGVSILVLSVVLGTILLSCSHQQTLRGRIVTGSAGNTPGASAPGRTALSVPAHKTVFQQNDPMVENIFDSQGNLDPVAYRRIAANYGRPEGIAYRFGPDYRYYHSMSESFSTYWGPPTRYRREANNPAMPVPYQVGTLGNAPGDYSSNQAQVMYTPDATSAPGVDHIATLEMGWMVYNERPGLTWTYYGQGSPVPDLLKGGGRVNAGPVNQPVDEARGYGHGEFAAEALLVFQDGLIATDGTNTANQPMYLKLPPHKVPTAISVTNNNEFALITVWDTQALKGQVAVVALGGTQREGTFWGYEWPELYPGFQNYGLYTFMKLLGFIDLPAMVAPTGISAVSDYPSMQWLSYPQGGNVLPGSLPLSNETNRQSFINGTNQGKYSRAGFAVVTSKSEYKAIVLDLRPLFRKVQTMYFTSRANFEAVRNSGQGANQWPYAFSAAPDFAPRVVGTLTLPHRPSAVKASLFGGPAARAYIATIDGTLHIYSVGGLGDGTGATPAALREVGHIAVGKNPTCISYMKEHGWGSPDYLRTQLIVVSRGDRRIDWIRLAGNTGSIVRTLRDSRLLDPIWADDNNNHGTESYLLSVADYRGRQLLNYRYGPIIYHTNGGATFGMGPDGRAPFEFGGAYPTKGGAFQISIENVT